MKSPVLEMIDGFQGTLNTLSSTVSSIKNNDIALLNQRTGPRIIHTDIQNSPTMTTQIKSYTPSDIYKICEVKTSTMEASIQAIQNTTGVPVTQTEIDNAQNHTIIRAFSPADVYKISKKEVDKLQAQLNSTNSDAWVSSVKDYIKRPHPNGQSHLLMLGHQNTYVDVNSGEMHTTKLWGGVYNDYAEYRNARKYYAAGTVVVESDNGFVEMSKRRLAKCPMVVSDTYGMAIGENISNDYIKPVIVGVSGRVLVSVEGDRFKYKVGDVLCAGKDGKATKMKWFEKILFPDRILGVVSEIPRYNIWGQDGIKIKDRIWIKIK